MADARRVRKLRRGMPWAGKRISVLLAERWPEHALSEATVGRIPAVHGGSGVGAALLVP